MLGSASETVNGMHSSAMRATTDALGVLRISIASWAGIHAREDRVPTSAAVAEDRIARVAAAIPIRPTQRASGRIERRTHTLPGIRVWLARPAAADLTGIAIEDVETRGEGSRRGGRRGRGRRGGRRQLPTDARAARQANGRSSLGTRYELTALVVLGAVGADAEPGGITSPGPDRAPAPAAPSRAVAVHLTSTESAAQSRTDALRAGRIEIPLLDAVGCSRAVRDTRYVGHACPRDVAERGGGRLTMKALGAVRVHGPAIGDDALAGVAAVVPGAVREAIVASTSEDLARRVDAERTVGTGVMASADGKIFRWQALCCPWCWAFLAGPEGVPKAALRCTGQPRARGRKVPILTRLPTICRRVSRDAGRCVQQKKTTPHRSEEHTSEL